MLYKFLWYIDRIFVYPWFRVKVHGRENIPKDRNFIICASHASNFDPIFLAGSIRGPIKIMAKKELFEKKLFGAFLRALGAFPVDRENMDLKTLRHSISLIKEGNVLVIFPEGRRVKDIDRKNVKDGAGYIALKAKADILPLEIVSTYKKFKRTDLYYKKPIKIDKYLSMNTKDGMKKLMDDTFYAMYEHRLEEKNKAEK